MQRQFGKFPGTMHPASSLFKTLQDNILHNLSTLLKSRKVKLTQQIISTTDFIWISQGFSLSPLSFYEFYHAYNLEWQNCSPTTKQPSPYPFNSRILPTTLIHQPLICSPPLQVCHFKNVIEMSQVIHSTFLLSIMLLWFIQVAENYLSRVDSF